MEHQNTRNVISRRALFRGTIPIDSSRILIASSFVNIKINNAKQLRRIWRRDSVRQSHYHLLISTNATPRLLLSNREHNSGPSAASAHLNRVSRLNVLLQPLVAPSNVGVLVGDGDTSDAP